MPKITPALYRKLTKLIAALFIENQQLREELFALKAKRRKASK
jgi:hypothetical protein